MEEVRGTKSTMMGVVHILDKPADILYTQPRAIQIIYFLPVLNLVDMRFIWKNSMEEFLGRLGGKLFVEYIGINRFIYN